MQATDPVEMKRVLEMGGTVYNDRVRCYFTPEVTNSY